MTFPVFLIHKEWVAIVFMLNVLNHAIHAIKTNLKHTVLILINAPVIIYASTFILPRQTIKKAKQSI